MIFVQIIVLGFLPLLYHVLNKKCHISQKIDFFKPNFVLECYQRVYLSGESTLFSKYIWANLKTDGSFKSNISFCQFWTPRLSTEWKFLGSIIIIYNENINDTLYMQKHGHSSFVSSIYELLNSLVRGILVKIKIRFLNRCLH